ncbi:MAG: adenylate/guanylate cyclase domain-containing protein [Rhodospirillales bacterium]|nr:adenylate/guanylate cyclase domain-containing protein [Rhodospirillales bacterium]MBO6786769.1 adenylate/guanylate cyclase domain-containing protein [Rhodospirillales bacterium]
MTEQNSNGGDADGAVDADRYDALFGRIPLTTETSQPLQSEEPKKGFWLELAENEGYERLNLAATYLAVFFAPIAAFLEMLGGTTELYWSMEAARWVEALMGIFFMFDICVGALAYGMKYFKTPAAWINILAVGATGASFLAGDVGIANPRVLRILRTVRAVAKVGLVQKVGTRETVLGAEMLSSMGRDDAWYAVGILLLISMLGDFSIGHYQHFSDPILEVIIYAGMVFAVRWKAERNVERVGKVFMDRLHEANQVILAKMREIPGLEDADTIIQRRAEEAESEGRHLNEIDTLIEAISMIISNLRRFISRRAFLEAKGERVIPTRSPVALMFTDVAGFQAMTHELEKDILPVLKTYLGEMNRGVTRHGGDIDKFLGEGIFAYFHNNEDPRTSANAAFDAAVEMHKLSEALEVAGGVWEEFLKGRNDWEGRRNFNTRFGLHWGLVVAGPVGDDDRADSTLIGDNVTLASRLESLNEVYGTQILVSSAFHECLSADRRVLCRRVDRVVFAGHEEPVDLYTVDISQPPVGFLLAFEKGVNAYLDGDWGVARGELLLAREALQEMDEDPDPATETLIKRIEDINSFWQKAVSHLRERVPEDVTEDTANALADRLSGDTWLPPHEWRGAWRIMD